MGPTLKEHGVLKLVHPGGLVEIHTIPITADEVMKKNPKHCVARPDVFKYPWIVVRPESVLKPGSVFYIVPHHTMRKLMLKAQENENENEQGTVIRTKDSIENISVEISEKRNRGKSIPKLGSSHCTRNGNKHSRVACYNQSAIEYSSVDLSDFNPMKKMTPSYAADKKENNFTVRKERNQEATKPNYHIIASPKDPYQREECEPDQLKILEKPVNDETEVHQQGDQVNTGNISDKSKRATGMKSCLKEQNVTNTASNLRVRFMLPGDEEKIMRTRLWLSAISPLTP